MNIDIARARRAGGKRSPISDVAAGAQTASPTPTPRRVTKSCQNVRVTPESRGEHAPDEHRRRPGCILREARSLSRPSGTPTKA